MWIGFVLVFVHHKKVQPIPPTSYPSLHTINEIVEIVLGIILIIYYLKQLAPDIRKVLLGIKEVCLQIGKSVDALTLYLENIITSKASSIYNLLCS
jgi:hypothetical protein